MWDVIKLFKGEILALLKVSGSVAHDVSGARILSYTILWKSSWVSYASFLKTGTVHKKLKGKQGLMRKWSLHLTEIPQNEMFWVRCGKAGEEGKTQFRVKLGQQDDMDSICSVPRCLSIFCNKVTFHKKTLSLCKFFWLGLTTVICVRRAISYSSWPIPLTHFILTSQQIILQVS